MPRRFEEFATDFLSGVSQNIVATAIGGICIGVGLSRASTFDDISNWSIWLTIVGAFLLIGFGLNAVRLIAGEFHIWRQTFSIRYKYSNSLNILIGNFEGENAQDVKDRILDQLQTVFGDLAL